MGPVVLIWIIPHILWKWERWIFLICYPKIPLLCKRWESVKRFHGCCYEFVWPGLLGELPVVGAFCWSSRLTFELRVQPTGLFVCLVGIFWCYITVVLSVFCQMGVYLLLCTCKWGCQWYCIASSPSRAWVERLRKLLQIIERSIDRTFIACREFMTQLWGFSLRCLGPSSYVFGVRWLEIYTPPEYFA